MDDLETSLTRLDAAHQATQDAAAALRNAVVAAREAGATWAQIGAVTGMTRQSAHERWGQIPRAGCPRAQCPCHKHRKGCDCGHA